MRWQRQTGAKGTPFILRWAEIVLKCSLMMRLAFFLMTFSFTQFSADVISLLVRMTLILIWISTRRWLHRVVWSERLRFHKLESRCFQDAEWQWTETHFIPVMKCKQRADFIENIGSLVMDNIMNTLALLFDVKQNFTCFFDSFFHSFSCCSDQSPLLVR